MKEKIRTWLSKYPLWLQTTVNFTVVVGLVVIVLIQNNFLYNKKNVIQNHTNHTTSTLKLEIDTVSQYIKDLTSFSIQPCYDSRLTRLIEGKAAFSEDDIEYIKEQMKGYYYSRTDLNSYNIFFLNHDTIVGRNRGAQHWTSSDLSSITDDDISAFNECSTSKYYLSIKPSDNTNDFITFYHSIIQIDNKASLAYVKCDIDKDFLNALIKGYFFEEDELLVLLNSDGNILYSSNGDIVGSDSNSELIKSTSNLQESSGELILNSTKYLYTSATDPAYGITLMSLTPYSIITKAETQLFIKCILQGLVIWVIFSIIIVLLCRFILAPLNSLSAEMKQMDIDSFDRKISIKGSTEIVNLSDSFNYMTEHIQQLIKENLLSQISEQSAKLIALEAQINPHFLYNTLQAISTEALVNNQPQIHEMVISLASILRYAIKDRDLVPLSDEIEYVNKYIHLNKIRMEDNLNVRMEIDPSTNEYLIPKISLQTLVENSIVHGISGYVTRINIYIRTYITDNMLHIEVKDDGIGMDKSSLENLRKSFTENNILSSKVNSLGLANIYTRLNILFDGNSTMSVDSKADEGTTVHLIIPITQSLRGEDESTNN